MPAQDRALALGQSLKLVEVDRHLGRERGFAGAFEILGQQLVDRDAVEGRDLVQPGHRDIPVAALVGRQQRTFEALVRQHLNLLQGQAALLAQAP